MRRPEGPLVVGGYALNVNGNTKQYNHPTTARIPAGAMVERGLTLDLTGRANFTLLLNDADFKSAGAMADSINKDLGRSAARTVDSRRIDLQVTQGEDIPLFLAKIEAVEVPYYPRAKVVVNERTGTVVIGGTVVLQPVVDSARRSGNQCGDRVSGVAAGAVLEYGNDADGGADDGHGQGTSR